MATRNRYAEIMAQYAQSQPYSFFGYPQAYTGGYDVAQPQPAAPVTRYEEIMAQPAMGGGGRGGKPVDYNPEWTGLSDAGKAAFYARSPFFSGATQLGQKLFGFTLPGALQKGVVPDFVARQELIARGIDPDTGRDLGGDALGNPLSSFGFVQAPGEAGRGGPAPVAPAPTGGFTPYSGTLNATRYYDGMGREILKQQAEQGGSGAVVSNPRSAAEAQARADAAAAQANAAAAANVGFVQAPGESGRGGGGGGRGGEGGSSNSNPGDPGRGGGGAHLAKGGYVSMQHLGGPDPEGPDDGYAALKDGEFVINDKAVKKYGIELMNAINSGKISKGKLRGLLEM